jgi:hypothetical protein
MATEQQRNPELQLQGLKIRIEQWRARRVAYERMPGDLREEAAALAQVLGASRVQSVLRLPSRMMRPSTLVRRLSTPMTPAARFIEIGPLPMPDLGNSSTVLELGDREGRHLTVRVAGGTNLDVCGLVSAFLRGSR